MFLFKVIRYPWWFKTYMDIEYWKSSSFIMKRTSDLRRSERIRLTSETSLISTESFDFESPSALLVAPGFCLFKCRAMLLLLTAWPHNMQGIISSFLFFWSACWKHWRSPRPHPSRWGRCSWRDSSAPLMVRLLLVSPTAAARSVSATGTCRTSWCSPSLT